MPTAQKRERRSVSIQSIAKKNGATCFQGRYGKRPTTTVYRSQPAARPAPTASSFPFRHGVAVERNRHQHQSEDGHGWSFEDGGSDQHQHDSADANRRQRSKQQQDNLWKERQPEHRFRRYCFLSGEQQRRQDFEAALIADFRARVSAVPLHCHACKTPDFIQPVLPAAAITFACINGFATVESPEHICCNCHKYVAVHPISVGCFPATPSRPEVWYDNQVLALTVTAQLSGPTAVQAQCAALKQLYLFNCPDTGRAAIWNNLGEASRQWQRVEVRVRPKAAGHVLLNPPTAVSLQHASLPH